jgi:hypothetical protein
MNEALCLLSTDSPQHVKSAEMMYLALREEYPNYILVQFRLAQALARLGSTDESIALFSETKNALANAARQHRSTTNWPDEIPKTDFSHMQSLLPKLMGYQFWRKAEEVEDRVQRMGYLLNAHDITKEALTGGGDVPNIRNNLVYYAMDYLSLAIGDPNSVTKRLANSLHANLASMEASMKNAPDTFDISTLDTMMEAYNFLGRVDLAQSIAGKILAAVKTSNESDPEETLSIIKTALHIQTLQAPSKPARTALDKLV